MQMDPLTTQWVKARLQNQLTDYRKTWEYAGEPVCPPGSFISWDCPLQIDDTKISFEVRAESPEEAIQALLDSWDFYCGVVTVRPARLANIYVEDMQTNAEEVWDWYKGKWEARTW
jgi:hypothetical protein